MNVGERVGICFLDTSALVKLYHQEAGTEVVEAWAADESVQLWISDLARAELHSAFVRRVREHELASADVEAVFASFREDLETRFQVVPLTAEILDQAISLLREHGTQQALRTLDALQIAAAQTVASRHFVFATADGKQLNAARRVFERVVDPEAPPADQQ